MFCEVEPAPRLLRDWILLGLSGQGRAGVYSRVISSGGCFQSFGDSSYRLRGGVFDPIRFVSGWS